MKRILLAALLATTQTPVFATPINHPPGSSLTYGGLSNNQSILSSVYNPAASAVVLQKKNRFGIGILSSIGVGLEIGAVDDLYNEVDSISNDFSNNFVDIAGTDPSVAALKVGQEIDRINNVLVKIEDKGYAKALGGSLVFDANATGGGQFTVMQHQINFDAQQAQAFIDSPTGTEATFGDVTVNVNDPNNPQFSVSNDSTVFLKGSKIYEYSIGYSREVMKRGEGSLFAGLRGKYFQAALLKDVQSVQDSADSQSSFDNISADDANKSSGFGLDLGVLWAASHYRLGASVTNINGPSFKYNKATAPNNYKDNRIINAINEQDSVKFDPQLKLEGALYSKSRNWVFGATADANAASDQYGDDYQWFNMSAAYATDSWWIPGGRVGFRKNLAGSKLSMAELGFTFFKFLNLDMAYGLQSVQYEGKKYPRTAYVNLGLELSF